MGCPPSPQQQDAPAPASIGGQLKAELIHRRGLWRTVEQLEYALFEYVDWWSHRRLHGEIGLRTPAEAEAAYYAQPGPSPRPVPNEPSLYKTQSGSAHATSCLRLADPATGPSRWRIHGTHVCYG